MERFKQFFIKNASQETLELNTNIDSLKGELYKHLGEQMNFIDLEVIGGDNLQNDTKTRIKTKGQYLIDQKIRENSQFNIEKKISAFTQSEQ
jgi:hypothetical protein